MSGLAKYLFLILLQDHPKAISMKKIVVLLILLLTICGDGVCNHISFSASDIAGDGSRTVIDIPIDIVTIGGGKPRPRPRSLLPVIEAELDLSVNQLFLVFNETVGKVTVTVKNSIGQVVSSCSFDTSFESMVVIGVTDTPDSYTICIEGDQIEASGYYDIMD